MHLDIRLFGQFINPIWLDAIQIISKFSLKITQNANGIRFHATLIVPGMVCLIFWYILIMFLSYWGRRLIETLIENDIWAHLTTLWLIIASCQICEWIYSCNMVWKIVVKHHKMLSAQFVVLCKPCKLKPKPKHDNALTNVLLICLMCFRGLWYLFVVSLDFVIYNQIVPVCFYCTTMDTGLILGMRPANERRRFKVTPFLIGWTQT